VFVRTIVLHLEQAVCMLEYAILSAAFPAFESSEVSGLNSALVQTEKSGLSKRKSALP
jgi:hypothetical protein